MSGRDATWWIAALGLRPHPEGGWFRETYRAAEEIPAAALPRRYGGPRRFATAIHFLLAAGEVSAFHRLASDEVWFLHAGGPLLVHVLFDRDHQVLRLGPDPERGEAFQAVVAAGSWFGAELAPGADFTLVGCAVAPGFDFADFELGERATLAAAYPQHRDLVERLTRG
jgi:predicted cupin superfamily sugar epimerase